VECRWTTESNAAGSPAVNEQQELFENAAVQGTTTPTRVDGSLIFSKSPHRPLPKAQQVFHRCVQRIEKLRQTIDQRRQALDAHLAFFHAEIRPLHQQLMEKRRERIPILHRCLTQNLLKSRQKKNQLRRLLQEELNEIMEPGGGLPSPELDHIFKELHGVSFEEAAQKDLEEMKEDLDFMANAFGADIDVDKIRPDMSPEEIARLFAEWDEKLRTAAETSRNQKPPQQKVRPKSARTQEREAQKRAADELRQRDLATLYKQLAKMLHPDLEQEPARRLEKEAAMKLLTTANREQDLHTMLRLKMEWILREQADLAHLTDKKLEVYNAVLKEQVKQLEKECREVHLHPRYGLLREFGLLVDFFDRNLVLNHLRRELKGMETSINSLQGPKAKDALHQLLESYDQRFSFDIPDMNVPF
jgi:hypothetical protein